MSYRLIATDIDGTLLRNDNSLPDENAAAIKKALLEGVKILPVSGRPYRFIAPVMEKLGLEGGYAVAMSGADVRSYPDGKSIMTNCISPEEIAEIYRFACGQGLVMLAFRLDGSYYADKSSKYADFYASFFKYDYGIAPMEHFPFHDVGKCMLLVEEERRSAVTKAAEETLSAGLRVEPIWSVVIDIYSSKTDKASAMMYVSDMLNISCQDIMALGDEIVDIPMLKAAGLGVAVGNAAAEVKLNADAVVASNMENGVAEAIYKFIQKDK